MIYVLFPKRIVVLFFSSDSRNIVCLLGLHKILPPTLLVTKHGTKKKGTILDSQESQIVFVPVLNDLDKIILDKQEFGRGQPLIVVIGNKINPKDFFVYLNNKYIICQNFLEAVDTCFKVFHLFNLEYPSVSSNVWLFLQKFFYKINLSSDKKVPKVSNLLNWFEKNQDA